MAVTIAIRKLCVLVFLVVPISSLLFSAVFGGMTAAVEEWDFWEGFIYILTLLVAANNPYINNNPTKSFGRALVVIFSVWYYHLPTYQLTNLPTYQLTNLFYLCLLGCLVAWLLGCLVAWLFLLVCGFADLLPC